MLSLPTGLPGLTASLGVARSGSIDARSFDEIRGIEQPGDRHLHEVGIADVLVAVGVGAAHRLGLVVNRRRRTGAALFVAGALEDAEHLEQRDAAGARRRRGDDGVVLVLAGQRRALDRLVALEIGQRDDAAVLRHLARRSASRSRLRRTRSAPFFEIRSSVCASSGCTSFSPIVVERAVALEDALRLRRARQAARSLQALRRASTRRGSPSTPAPRPAPCSRPTSSCRTC